MSATDMKNRLNDMLFDYETTYKTDFHGGEVKEVILTKYKPKKPRVRPEAKLTKDIHTLSDWKGNGVPFSLLHKPKAIIRTNPTNVQVSWAVGEDKGLSEAIRTRPRLVMTPAISVDDIEIPETRSVLINNTYVSETTKAQREAVATYFSVKAPLPDLPAPANPVKLPKLQPPRVPPEWRMKSVGWDREQIRTFCDPTMEFWLRREPARCGKCDEMATALANKQSRQVVKRT